MSLLDHLFAVGPIRKTIWRLWYPFLTRRLRADEILFLNYAYEENPPMGIPLNANDEKNRACVQLYHHVGSQISLGGKRVLEVSCGHGGGASYLMRTFRPAEYTGLDLNPQGVCFCRDRHRINGLSFVQGDAENLPFESGSFDVVVNVEASHCYPHFSKFLSEVARVLKPGGHFLYADFRFEDGRIEWEQAINSAPLEIVRTALINAEVLRGMTANSEKSVELVRRHLPRFMVSLGKDFAGVEGSRVFNALKSGELTYRSYCFRKPD